MNTRSQEPRFQLFMLPFIVMVILSLINLLVNINIHVAWRRQLTTRGQRRRADCRGGPDCSNDYAPVARSTGKESAVLGVGLSEESEPVSPVGRQFAQVGREGREYADALVGELLSTFAGAARCRDS